MPERYQDEIEEILRKAGEAAPGDAARERPRADDRVVVPVRAPDQAPNPAPSQRRRWPRLTPGKLMLLGLALFVIGALWGSARPLVWVGLGMTVLAYLLFFVSPRSIEHEKRWRGQVVEEYDSPWQRLRRWLTR